MSHPLEFYRRQIRLSYIWQGLSLSAIALLVGISLVVFPTIEPRWALFIYVPLYVLLVVANIYNFFLLAETRKSWRECEEQEAMRILKGGALRV